MRSASIARSLPDDSPSITAILREGGDDIRDTLASLWPLVYDDLRRVAARRLREHPHDSLPPTGLVHELFIRLVGASTVRLADRAHFFALASRAMRAILVDRSRARRAMKRPPVDGAIALDPESPAPATILDVLEIDHLLGRLASVDADLAQLVELRVFGGLTIDDVADVVGVSPVTVKRRWRVARAWLIKEMSPEAGGSRR